MELRVEKLSLPKKGGGWLLHDVSFEVKKGEIFGIYGLLGAGRSELMECIMGLLLSQKAEDEDVDKVIDEIHIKVADKKLPILSLSGGNQQKVVISKWILRDCDVLIFDEPTRGIDVGAKSEIYKLMTQLAEEGKSIIMISSDMPELLRLSDRVIVMCEGHVTGELDISEATQETIMTYATKREVG